MISTGDAPGAGARVTSVFESVATRSRNAASSMDPLLAASILLARAGGRKGRPYEKLRRLLLRRARLLRFRGLRRLRLAVDLHHRRRLILRLGNDFYERRDRAGRLLESAARLVAREHVARLALPVQQVRV